MQRGIYRPPQGWFHIRNADGGSRITRRARYSNLYRHRHRYQRAQAGKANLAAQKDLLETILQQAAEAIVVCDAQDNPILVNAAARRLALVSSREHAGSSPKFLWGKAYYPDGHSIPLQAWPLQQALRGNTTSGAEVRMVRPDGTHHDVLISAAPIRSAEQRIIGAVAIFSDISERKRVEEKLLYQLRLTQGITDSATESIFVTDAKGMVTFLNPEASRVFGFSPEEIIGKSLHETIHSRYPDGRLMPAEQCRLGRTYVTGETIRDHQDLFHRKDGTTLTMSCSSALLENKGKRLGAVFPARHHRAPPERKSPSRKRGATACDHQCRSRHAAGVGPGRPPPGNPFTTAITSLCRC